MRTLIAFTPAAILNGGEDAVLQSDDIVRVLSVSEARLITSLMQDYSRRQSAQQEALRSPSAPELSNGQQRAASNGQLSGNGNGGPLPVDSAEQNAQGGMANRQNPPAMAGASEAFPGQPRPFQQNAGPDNMPGNGEDPSQANTRGGAPNPSSRTNSNGSNSVFQSPLPDMGLDYQLRNPPVGGYALNREATTFGQLASQLGADPLVLMNFLLDHQATMTGAVRGPGLYIVGPNVPLQDLVTAAGGTVNWADTSGVELITTAVEPSSGRSQTRRTQLALNQTLASYVVRPHDEFRFNQVFIDTDVGIVTVQGEVRFTGNYRLTRGERLSDLLARAGGLTNAAYPYGTVFLRKSVAALEREGFMRAAREVEDQLVAALTRAGTNRVEAQTFTSLQGFVTELRNQQALGRVSIVADPSVLASRPDIDPLLEPGDLIYIPQRPSTISVLGQVMQPGSFPYRQGESVGDYIARAGGYGAFADERQTFVVLPDGTARKVEKSWLRFEASAALPPGSAIVVPRDLMPFDLRQTLIDVSQILSQFAVSIASVAVISKQ